MTSRKAADWFVEGWKMSARVLGAVAECDEDDGGAGDGDAVDADECDDPRRRR